MSEDREKTSRGRQVVNIENRKLCRQALLTRGIDTDAQWMVIPTTFHILGNILGGNEEN
jgi:hypothetical protein